MIPAKLIVTGDIPRGKEFIGFAKNQLSILRNQMSYQKLNEGFRTVKPFPGVVVEVWASFKLAEIKIHATSEEGGGPGGDFNRKDGRKCLCLPHFALGVIVSAEYGENSDEAVYDAEICSSSNYVMYLGLMSNGWARHYVGQYILVTIGEEMESWDVPFDCNRECLVDNPRFDILMISPISISNKMRRWFYETE